MFRSLPGKAVQWSEELVSPFLSSWYKILQPWNRSFFLADCAKVALTTDGVLGVPTSLRDRLTLDVGVFITCSVISLLLVGVGGHLRSPNSSLFLRRLPASPHVPNKNCNRGTQTCWPNIVVDNIYQTFTNINTQLYRIILKYHNFSGILLISHFKTLFWIVEKWFNWACQLTRLYFRVSLVSILHFSLSYNNLFNSKRFKGCSQHRSSRWDHNTRLCYNFKPSKTTCLNIQLTF